MSKLKYFIGAVVVLLVVVLIATFFVSPQQNWTDGINADFKVFKPYVVGTEIDFSKSGNSEKYIVSENGWGGQEPKWRCIVGDTAELKLYVKDGQDSTLFLKISGFGVYNKQKDTHQKITVLANDTKIDEWQVRENNTYVAKIPASVMTGDILVIKLLIDKPYVSNIDIRPLGMAVKKIQVTRQAASQTKIKIGRWLKNKLKNIEVPEYED